MSGVSKIKGSKNGENLRAIHLNMIAKDAIMLIIVSNLLIIRIDKRKLKIQTNGSQPEAHVKEELTSPSSVTCNISNNQLETSNNWEVVEISTEGEIETVTPADSLSDETISINIENNEKPEINQYWEITNGKDSLHAYVVETDPFMMQFFESNTSISDAYRLNDVKFEVLPKDFVRKVKDLQLAAVGRILVNYVF